MRLNPNERNYPAFNDQPHERPVLSNAGTNRALLALAGIVGGTGLLAVVVSMLH
ncbi:MAG: hypothetical protein U0768_10870 [Anaerolineae bacterium]